MREQRSHKTRLRYQNTSLSACLAFEETPGMVRITRSCPLIGPLRHSRHLWDQDGLGTEIVLEQVRTATKNEYVNNVKYGERTTHAKFQISTLPSQGAPRKTSGARRPGGCIHSFKCLSFQDALHNESASILEVNVSRSEQRLLHTDTKICKSKSDLRVIDVYAVQNRSRYQSRQRFSQIMFSFIVKIILDDCIYIGDLDQDAVRLDIC